MQSLLAVLLFLFATLLLPHIWGRLMSNAPEWAERIVQFAFILVSVSMVLLSDPVLARLKAPNQHRVASTLIVSAATALVFGACWWLFIAAPKPVPKVARLEVKAHIPAGSFGDGIKVHGIDWKEPWLPIYFDVINHGPTIAYELEMLFGTFDRGIPQQTLWIMEVRQTAGPTGLELRAGSGAFGPEVILEFDDGEVVPIQDAKVIGNKWRLYLPRLSRNDRLGMFMAIGQPKDAKSRDESIQRLLLGYRGTFASAPGAADRHMIQGDVIPLRPLGSRKAAPSPSQGA
jgi:hypothetical protein